ncbi:MAG TPA: NHLP leader peptide family RiPP precursor [Elusimicrobiota bacterium]|nr:NHLP leader peptide family RiPP precursor [Elusimicrobiota bacterium]
MAEEQMKDKIIKKALTDPAFKKALIANPNAAIEKELGMKIPAGLTVKVVEDAPNTVHLVLPAVPAKGELGDADLEKVSGGTGGCGVSQWPAGDPKLYTKISGICVENTAKKC